MILALSMTGAPLHAASTEPEERNYFRRHMWHWVIAFGTSLADSEYEDRVGYSTDPLIFSDPPGIDRWVRDWLAREDYTEPFVVRNASQISLAAGAATIVFANLGEGRAMADDATGFVEAWFFDKGASGLVKNIFGRQRPELEYIDEQEELTPEEREEEEEKRTNHQSFYSGSASRQFTLMSYLDRIVAGRTHSKAARAASFVGFYGYAAYIAGTRLTRDRHYFTDIVAGAAAGIYVGRKFYEIHHRPEPEPPKTSRVRLTSLAVGRDGFAVMFSVERVRP